MKAIAYSSYGPPEVLQVKEIARPRPGEKQLLIRVIATAVNSADWRLRKADPFAVRIFFGLTKPRKAVLGGVFSGVVEEIGKDVKRFKPGDAVYGSAGLALGAYAEYMCVSEDAVLDIKPAKLSHAEAAVIPFGGSTALQFLQKAKIKQGQEILIYGASGAVGTAAVQIAKHFGAQVTGVCSEVNLALVKSLGADKVINYNTDDFTSSQHKYDVVMETVNKLPVSRCLQLLKNNGTLILGAASFSEMIQGLWTSMKGGRKVLSGPITEKVDDIRYLTKLVEKGELRPVIDRTYSLDQMAEAHVFVELGHKKGSVAIRVSEN